MEAAAKSNVETHIRGLYAITPDWPDSGTLEAMLQEAFNAGVRLLQYRRKTKSDSLQRFEAERYCQMAKAAGARLIVNDDLALAQFVGAHGVHWGREDVPLVTMAEKIRATKLAQGDAFIIGISCYDDFLLAEAAIAAGADYVAFGSMFASPTKPNASSASLDLIRRAKRAFEAPIVAIGGITVDNAASAIDAGADSLAVISGIFAKDSNDEFKGITARVKRFSTLFENDHRHDSPI